MSCTTHFAIASCQRDVFIRGGGREELRHHQLIQKPLKLVQSLPTLGATDFKAFTISGTTFLAVSNEQDDRLGGDVDSTIWALSGGRAAPKEEL